MAYTRLIPAIFIIAAAFLVPAPTIADEVEADAIFATTDCVDDEAYLVDEDFAFECHMAGLEKLAFLSSDVSASCTSLWETLYVFHAIGIAGVTFPYDISVVEPTGVLPEDITLAAMACFGS